MICLYRKMRHKWERYEFFLFPVCCRIVIFFAVVLEFVTQGVCLCVTTPRATSRKTAPFYFIRIRQSRYFLADFVSEKHLFVAYFASKCKLLDKDKSDFYHKDLLRVYQKQNLALSLSLSWFKPASALIWKYECWCEFEKDLEVFQYSFSETIPIFFIRLSANIVNVLHSKVATKFKLKCTGHGGMHDPH